PVPPALDRSVREERAGTVRARADRDRRIDAHDLNRARAIAERPVADLAVVEAPAADVAVGDQGAGEVRAATDRDRIRQPGHRDRRRDRPWEARRLTELAVEVEAPAPDTPVGDDRTGVLMAGRDRNDIGEPDDLDRDVAPGGGRPAAELVPAVVAPATDVPVGEERTGEVGPARDLDDTAAEGRRQALAGVPECAVDRSHALPRAAVVPVRGGRDRRGIAGTGRDPRATVARHRRRSDDRRPDDRRRPIDPDRWRRRR